MHVLLTTDAFPPICGGSGWSTFELARGLRALGHRVSIVRPRPGEPAGVRIAHYDGFTVHEIGHYAPRVPYLRNYYKNERLSHDLARWLRPFIREQAIDIIHAQHVLSTPASIRAVKGPGERGTVETASMDTAPREPTRETAPRTTDRVERGTAVAGRYVPIVCTVRDYWPVCYWSDLILDFHASTLCPACSAGMMTRCVRPRAGALWPAALPLIPYMRRNLRWKRDTLSQADAVIAVSSTIARDLRDRAPELSASLPRRGPTPPGERPGEPASEHQPRTRIEIIPNPVDVRAIRETAAATPSAAIAATPQPYAIYVGKLAPNKGSAKLMTAVNRANLAWPLVIVGDGPDRAEVEAAARTSGRDVRFTGWLHRNEALRWLAHASVVIFPSHGPESLSRVLLEAGALGVPAAAMDTGGTRDIITHEQTGLLSSSPEELGDHVSRLVADTTLRTRLGTAARAFIDAHFDAPAVVSRIVALYEELLATTRGAGPAPSDGSTDHSTVSAPEATRAHA
jgi:glycosyltransferase involved in cell wall biosynthesis